MPKSKDNEYIEHDDKYVYPRDENGEPLYVPILEARDIHKRQYYDSSKKDCMCLSGWCVQVFGSGLLGKRRQPVAEKHLDVREMIRRKLIRLAREKEITRSTWITDLNDHELMHNSELAQAWNETMQELGYTEVTSFKGES